MKYLPKVLIYVGAYHLVSSIVLYTFIRMFAYQEFQAQYARGGIEAIFSVTEGNYHFGLFLTFIFALAAIFRGFELKEVKKISSLRLVTNGILVAVVILSSVYITFLNLLILFNPGYF